MNKRVVSVILLMFLLSSIIFNVGFVSADDTGLPDSKLSEGLGKVGNELGGMLGRILIFLFNIPKDAQGTDIAQTLISFIFAFIIVFVFLLLAFKNIPFFDYNRGLSYFIVIVASLLGIRGIAQISPSIMQDIFMPYSAVALAIINGAVIVGWFALVNIGMKRDDFKFIRRFLWILFGVTFIGIWGMRTFFTKGQEVTSLIQWIYWATIILSFIMALLDGTIQGFFAQMKAEKLKHLNKTKQMANLMEEFKDLQRMLNNQSINKDQFKVLKKELQDRAGVLGLKHLKRFT